jgi:hypothetical protein
VLLELKVPGISPSGTVAVPKTRVPEAAVWSYLYEESGSTHLTGSDPTPQRTIQAWEFRSAPTASSAAELTWRKVSGSAADDQVLKIQLKDTGLLGQFFHSDLQGSFAEGLTPPPVLLAANSGGAEGSSAGRRNGLKVSYEWHIRIEGSKAASYDGKTLELVGIERSSTEEVRDSSNSSERATYSLEAEDWYSPELGLFVGSRGRVTETSHPRFEMDKRFALKLDGLEFI